MSDSLEQKIPASGLDAQLLDDAGLNVQCAELQRQLARQRHMMQQQWCPAAELENPTAAHFPRSATMRFLSRSKNVGLLLQFAGWQLARRFPGWIFWKK